MVDPSKILEREIAEYSKFVVVRKHEATLNFFAKIKERMLAEAEETQRHVTYLESIRGKLAPYLIYSKKCRDHWAGSATIDVVSHRLIVIGICSTDHPPIPLIDAYVIVFAESDVNSAESTFYFEK